MVLVDSCLDKLSKIVSKEVLRFEFDCRYLTKWVTLCPQCFPLFVRKGEYTLFFNPSKIRYELWKS
jgi:hypothetical protein